MTLHLQFWAAFITLWHLVYLRCHLPNTSSTWHFIYLILRLPDTSSTWYFGHLTLHLPDISSTWHFIYLTLRVPDTTFKCQSTTSFRSAPHSVSDTQCLRKILSTLHIFCRQYSLRKHASVKDAASILRHFVVSRLIQVVLRQQEPPLCTQP